MSRELLVVSLGGTACGIGKGDVSSLSPGRPLHRLPLSPPAMAGLAVIDGRSASIFDLAACLGMPPRATGGRENILLIDSGGRLTGFVVNGPVDSVAAEDDSLQPLPAAVRNEVVETCLVRDGSVIPIIDIRKLHSRVERGDIDLPAPPVPAVASSFTSDLRVIRLFTLGSGLFCMNGEGTSFLPGAQAVTTLAYAARPVFGALVLGSAVIAAVDLAHPLGLEGPKEPAGHLIAPAGGGTYAFPIEEDRGMAEGGWQVLPLPPVTRTDRIPAAAVRDGVIAPMVDPAAVFVRSPKDERGALLAGQYHPASGFGSRFRKGNVEIVELSLLGMLHGIPKDEVKEIFPVQPWRQLPGLPEIVVGVAERGGKLYAVLDLAAIFGRRSQPTEQWRMLRVENGDFHALVLAEAVEDGRIIAPDAQRQVPISLPHQVLYGCYLDERAVRLILNVFSLAVHFEKTEVRELIASLTPPVEPPVVRLAPEAPLPKEAVPGQPEHAAPVPLPVVPLAAEERPSEAGETRGKDERDLRDEAMARAAAAARALEAGRKEQEEEVRRSADKAREQERAAAEARKKAEIAAAEQAEEARKKAEADARRTAAEQERSRAEAEAREREALEAQQRQEEEQRRYDQEQLRREEERKADVERLAQEQERRAVAERLSIDQAQPSAVPAKRGRKHAIAVAALVIAAVIAMVLLMPKSATPPEKSPAPVAEPAKREPAPPARKEPEAPLVLNVPASMPRPETVVYVVVKGDTLWGISKRFTGNPFNYPRVAKDNSIATPDLIFPGQKIHLKQQAAAAP